MKIKQIDVYRLDLPFRGTPGRYMEAIDWANFYSWGVIDFYQVETDNGIKGYGEMIPQYTWSDAGRELSKKFIGRDPFKLLWDDSLGSGLQMAVYDIVGKALDIPCYNLFGKKIREKCPVSWWVPDMSTEGLVKEVKTAIKKGYRSLKMKARPWYDLKDQIQSVIDVINSDFKLTLDFNDLLLNSTQAIPILKELESFSNISFFETPIPHSDVRGYKRIKSKISVPVATHYNDPPVSSVIYQDINDAYIVSGGCSSIIGASSVAEIENKPFWLQLVGTGITTALTLHLGAVLKNAVLPAVNCMEIFQENLIKDTFKISDGYMKVPEKPGLGIDIDFESINKYKVEPDYIKSKPESNFSFIKDGKETKYHDALKLYEDFKRGNQPLCEKGCKLEIHS